MADDKQRKSIPLLFVKGTHYEVGYQVGHEFKDRINTFLAAHPNRENILSFYSETEGKEFCDSLLSTCRAKYPHYIEEIKGIADGAGIDQHELELLHLNKEISVYRADQKNAGATLRIFDNNEEEESPSNFQERLNEWVDLGCTDVLLNKGKELLLMHLEQEVMVAMDAMNITTQGGGDMELITNLGCTDLLLNNKHDMVIGHNMDYYVAMGDTLYMVCAHILPYRSRAGREFPEEKFVSHQYTGFLFGGNCCFNMHGLVYCLGATYPRDTGPGRIPEVFLRRHFLTATSPADAMRILESPGTGVATGFAIHFTFTNQKMKTIWSAEVGPSSEEKKSELSVVTVNTECGRPFYAHTNHYEHLKISHYVGQSSAARRSKVEELPIPVDEEGIKAILGNIDNDMYPVYRSPSVSKKKKLQLSCVYTGIFNLTEGKYKLYLDNPAHCCPILTLSLDMLR